MLNPCFILFDLIGTTFIDSTEDGSLIINSFINAFSKNGIHLDVDNIKRERGKLKTEAIKNLLGSDDENRILELTIFNDFMQMLNDSIESIKPIDSAMEVFDTLRTKRVKIGLGSGLPLDFINHLIVKSGWNKNEFDYLNSSENLGEGRPNPIMINNAIQSLEITNRSQVIKVGDTIVDMKEGKNANVCTIGVLTGSSSRSELIEAGADYVLNDIREILQFLD